MGLLRDYHAGIGEIVIEYSGTLERYAGDGVTVVFNDPACSMFCATRTIAERKPVTSAAARFDPGALRLPERRSRFGGTSLAHSSAPPGHSPGLVPLQFSGRNDEFGV